MVGTGTHICRGGGGILVEVVHVVEVSCFVPNNIGIKIQSNGNLIM